VYLKYDFRAVMESCWVACQNCDVFPVSTEHTKLMFGAFTTAVPEVTFLVSVRGY